jgi:hypothetical protein
VELDLGNGCAAALGCLGVPVISSVALAAYMRAVAFVVGAVLLAGWCVVGLVAAADILATDCA